MADQDNIALLIDWKLAHEEPPFTSYGRGQAAPVTSFREETYQTMRQL
jgi:hypothetical protein